MKEVSRPAID